MEKDNPKVAQMEPKCRKNEQLNIHAKIDAEKTMKSMLNGIQNDAKMDTKIVDSSCFFVKGENARNCLFYNRKHGSGHPNSHQKSIQNQCKIDA